MRRTYWYAAETKDAAQHRSWTFYEVVNNVQSNYYCLSTAYAGSSIPAWDIDLGTGYVISEGKNTLHYVWAVGADH